MDGQVEIGRLIWLNSRKVRRRHADDRIGEILNRKRLTDDFFIRVKRTSPVVKAQNDNGGTVWSFIIAWSKEIDRKSTRLNSSHRCISYAVFCLKKKNC